MTDSSVFTPRSTGDPSAGQSDAKNGHHSSGVESSSERWRPVVGYEGLYEVSDCGKVRSLYSGPRRNRYVLVQQRDRGYRYVSLYRDGKGKKRAVHQLVLEAFVGPMPPGCGTRHLNSVRHDNRLENLAWGTPSENARDRFITGVSVSSRTEMWNR